MPHYSNRRELAEEGIVNAAPIVLKKGTPRRNAYNFAGASQFR